MYPEDYKYSEEHEWVRLEDDLCVVGITSFAQEQLGEVVYVEMPEVGSTFEAGDEIGTIESVKAVAEIYTPITGEIVEVNETLDDTPEQVNEDPHEDGWLVKIRASASDELGALMDADAYRDFIASAEE